MKKLLLSLLALMAVVSASAGSYTITFKSETGNSDSTSAIKADVSGAISDGAEYVSELSGISYVYLAKEGYGLKFGKSKTAGTVTINLKESVRVLSITANAAQYGSSEAKAEGDMSVYLKSGETPLNCGVSGLSFADYTVNFAGGVETTEIYLLSTNRAYLKSITIEYQEVDPDAAPETPVVTVNGQSYGNDAEIEVVKGDMVSVVSANATEMIVNGESVAVSGGTYEFAAETSDIYTFQGKNGEKTSEEVTVMLDVDDLGWQVIINNESKVSAMFDFTDYDSLHPTTPFDAPTKASTGTPITGNVFTDGIVSMYATKGGSNDAVMWLTTSKATQMRVYKNGGKIVVSVPDGYRITYVDLDINANYLAYTGNDGVGTYVSTDTHYEWIAKDESACTNIDFSVKDGTCQVEKIVVNAVSGSSETLVKAPEFYVNDVLLDAAGDYMKGIEVEAGAVIKAVGHERTHVHYYVEGEDAAAANVKALMAVNADELPWNVNEGAQKHVFEYIVPDAQSQDITIYAKAAKEGYKSQVTQMVLSADRVATGIEAVESGEGEGTAEYFNLQGQRVMNPANGLFIKKAAGKVTKVVL